jgi:hypothetical protein
VRDSARVYFSKEDFVKQIQYWAAALIIGLLAIGCNTQNADPPQPEQKAAGMASQEMPKGHPPIGQMPSGQMPSGQMPSGHPTVSEEGPTISGTISLAPELTEKASPEAVLYIIARREGDNTPVAVARLKEVTFPATYTLSRQHMMGPPGAEDQKVEVTARLDKDGFVGPPQPGDIEGSYPKNPVPMGEKNVDFKLDKIR